MSKSTYERLKTYCDTNGISMSQFIERRVGDYLSCGQGLPAPRAGGEAEREVTISADQIFTF